MSNYFHDYFNFFDLPTDIKSIIFQKNRDVALHRRHTRWMHHELSTINIFYPITREEVDHWGGACTLHPSDLFERQDADDLNSNFSEDPNLSFPYYHDRKIHDKKYLLHEELYGFGFCYDRRWLRVCFHRRIAIFPGFREISKVLPFDFQKKMSWKQSYNIIKYDIIRLKRV